MLNEHFMLRFENGREVGPRYIPAHGEARPVYNACEMAAHEGYSSVWCWDSFYVQFGGEWYCWNLPGATADESRGEQAEYVL
ncbi:MAG TPA: hypothetical protein PK406_00700 [Verrucomicrobiota bacterium]|nr:hypothetical protein [Verrucomicrobiota bacterium]